jgi:hypothetical protein
MRNPTTRNKESSNLDKGVQAYRRRRVRTIIPSGTQGPRKEALVALLQKGVHMNSFGERLQYNVDNRNITRRQRLA